MNEFDFGPLTPYIEDENVTDINYNGKTLWIDHLIQGRYPVSFDEEEFIKQFCFKMANYVNCSFNLSSPLIEAETKDLRISILHESIARSGHSISIRKTPAILRLNRKKMIKEKYATAEIIDFLETIVSHHCNILVSGLPGSGKTELIKFLTQFIPDNERIITIEDTLELRAHNIYEEKDCVAMRVNSQFTYVDAIKASLRQRPNWILVSEVRSHEVVHLLESVSTGTHLMSTVHAYDATKIPQRILHMFPDVEITNESLLNTIHENLDFGIHIESTINEEGVKRRIAQIVAYDVENHHPTIQTIFDGNQLNLENLPPKILFKLKTNEKKATRKKVKK